MRIILASASPRRRELLTSLGLEFEVRPSSVEEVPRADEPVVDYVRRLSREKAASIARDHQNGWVIGADTVVFIDDEILEKPIDAPHAVSMLDRIQGRTHTVYTAVALQNAGIGFDECRFTDTRVTMVPLSQGDIEWYVRTGEPMDKAGAYAVQGIGAMFIESIDGNYTNVVGLPLSTLLAMMRHAGIDPISHDHRSHG